MPYVTYMSIESTILEQVLELPEDKRAFIIAGILNTLPSPLHDNDEGIAEATRRSREMNEDPSCIVSWDDIKKELGR